MDLVFREDYVPPEKARFYQKAGYNQNPIIRKESPSLRVESQIR